MTLWLLSDSLPCSSCCCCGLGCTQRQQPAFERTHGDHRLHPTRANGLPGNKHPPGKISRLLQSSHFCHTLLRDQKDTTRSALKSTNLLQHTSLKLKSNQLKYATLQQNQKDYRRLKLFFTSLCLQKGKAAPWGTNPDANEAQSLQLIHAHPTGSPSQGAICRRKYRTEQNKIEQFS